MSQGTKPKIITLFIVLGQTNLKCFLKSSTVLINFLPKNVSDDSPGHNLHDVPDFGSLVVTVPIPISIIDNSTFY